MSSSHFTFGTFGPEDPETPPYGGTQQKLGGRVPPVPIGSYAHGPAPRSSPAPDIVNNVDAKIAAELYREDFLSPHT